MRAILIALNILHLFSHSSAEAAINATYCSRWPEKETFAEVRAGQRLRERALMDLHSFTELFAGWDFDAWNFDFTRIPEGAVYPARLRAFVIETIWTGLRSLKPINPELTRLLVGQIPRIAPKLRGPLPLEVQASTDCGSAPGRLAIEFPPFAFRNLMEAVEPELARLVRIPLEPALRWPADQNGWSVSPDFAAFARILEARAGAEASAAVRGLLAIDVRNVRNSIFHEFLHAAGMMRDPGHGPAGNEELNIKQDDPVYACAAQVYPDDWIFYRADGDDSRVYSRTRRSCETCAALRVNGQDVVVDRTQRSTACAGVRDADFRNDSEQEHQDARDRVMKLLW